MFKRSFMQAFKIRKNANPSAYLGSISSNFAYVVTTERKLTRVGLYIISALIMINATSDFEFFYQTITHYPAPVNRTYYELSVPKQIKQANHQVIENWKKIHEARKLLKTFDVQA